MNGVVARRNNFAEPILNSLKTPTKICRADRPQLRPYQQYKTDDAETVFVSLGSAAENIEAASITCARRAAQASAPSTST
jgi:pyruvate-ferredoxin/flavodoxin oxidoreductase